MNYASHEEAEVQTSGEAAQDAPPQPKRMRRAALTLAAYNTIYVYVYIYIYIYRERERERDRQIEREIYHERYEFNTQCVQ